MLYTYVPPTPAQRKQAGRDEERARGEAAAPVPHPRSPQPIPAAPQEGGMLWLGEGLTLVLGRLEASKSSSSCVVTDPLLPQLPRLATRDSRAGRPLSSSW